MVKFSRSLENIFIIPIIFINIYHFHNLSNNLINNSMNYYFYLSYINTMNFISYLSFNNSMNFKNYLNYIIVVSYINYKNFNYSMNYNNFIYFEIITYIILPNYYYNFAI